MFYRKIINEYETALVWRNGKIEGTLKPGRYWLPWSSSRKIKVFDMRIISLRIPGQEVTLGDRTSLKINVAGTYKLKDPKKLSLAVAERELPDCINQMVQLRLRDVAAATDLDRLLEKRDEVNDALEDELSKGFDAIGLELLELKIKDVILPAELRGAYVESLSAQLKAKAQLEQARGQSAALRNLANTADLLEKHPQLVQVLSLQKKDSNLNLYFEQSVHGREDQTRKA